jgi:phospholipid/cholesterol/gamma-HCH transport system substrate-binding protein
MSRGVRIRLMAFVVLSAVGITYVAATYLGIVDRVTGRNISVTVTLPQSGGLFEGSEVTYRGVKIGRVSTMTPTEEGVELELALEEDTELPTDSRMYVHNLSAVGEQYLDFEPGDQEPPYAEDGAVFHGDADSLPVDEGDLLVDVDRFVNSVDHENLQVAVEELGLLFGDTGRDLQTMLDSGSVFIDEASEHTDETIALLENGLTVLRTQRGQKENIRAFADDLATVTAMLRGSDKDLRKVLRDTPGAAREVQALLEDLEPSLPILLSDLTTTGQIVTSHIAGLEHLLVLFPTFMAGGPTGSTRDGWGHINLQFDYSTPPCTEGYKPQARWASPHDVTDNELYPAKCLSGPPYNMRGSKYAPGLNRGPTASPGRVYSGSYDAMTGRVPGVVDANGNPVEIRAPGDLSVLGGDAWKWMLVGPVATP